MAKRVTMARVVGLALAGCLAAGCSTGDDSAVTTASTETTAVTDTTETTVQAASSSSSTETTASTTELPADPIAAAEQAAAQAVLDKEDAWRVCISDVPTCDVDAALAASTTGESLEKRKETLETWRGNGWLALPPVDPAHVGDEIIEVEIYAEQTRARVRHCQIDGGVLVDPGAGSDGSDVIINDDVVSVLSDDTVILGQDGIWRVEQIEVVSRTEGGGGCDLGV